MRCDSLLINVKCTWIEVDEIWCVFVDLGMCVLAARSLTVLRHRSQALWLLYLCHVFEAWLHSFIH